MWVEDVPSEELAAEVQQWEEEKRRHIAAGGSIAFTVPPAPIRVIVKWLESWSPAVLEEELDSETRRLHEEELTVYPDDYGLDPLGLQEATAEAD